MNGARWIRVVLVLLAVPNMVTGGWALVAPEHWFEHFPGWAPRLVAAYPPYNQHLVTDAGAGLFAAGVAAALAAWWMRREVVAVLMGVYLAFALPHAVFHVANPSDILSGGDDAISAGSVIVSALGALVVLAVTIAHPPRPVVA